MALFDSEWVNNKPGLKTNVHITLRSNGLFVESPEFPEGFWLQFQLDPHEKRALLRTLLAEFIEGGL